MADFCKQCSIDMFNEDFNDLKGIGSRVLTEEENEVKTGWRALCEGCGPTLVNDEGECISINCIKNHGKN